MLQLFRKILLILFLGIPVIIYAQENSRKPKQTNETGKDVLADAPWRMRKTDDSGNPIGIPIHVFIKDADGLGSNAELIYINIYIKNATDTSFGTPVTFETYTDSAFLSLFSAKSYTDADFDIQSFDESLPVKDPNYTIQFTANDCAWPDECQFVDITHRLWYFTITIPPEKLAGLDDIVDINVYFSLNWNTDDESFLRVFRYDENLPSLPGWYRGDVHYHTVYTDNTAEFGLPLTATKEAGKRIGMDWIASVNHSCDYDNYGVNMQNNWNRETAEIQLLNEEDSTFIYLHGMEASIQNSADNCVHMLCYPYSEAPYALPFIGDGTGDMTGTTITIGNMLDSLAKYNGFAYAAHPFAGHDNLSALVDGGIWNVNDADFFSNGATIPGNDVVICNDPSYLSDLYSVNSITELFRSGLKGAEIWNYRNSLSTTDEAFNPWNVSYDSGVTPFTLYDTSDIYYHKNRFLQGLEVTKFLLKKGLIAKNSDHNLSNYKFFISAGSDAHGDFNYSNTNFVYGVTSDISDATLGRDFTAVYCPSGMGTDGGNVLSALENGKAVISDGPLVTIGISTDDTDSTSEYFIGDEILPGTFDYQNAKLKIDLASSFEFGNFHQLKFITGTQSGEHIFCLPVDSSIYFNSFIFNLDSLVQTTLAGESINCNEYFYIRAELTTFKNYDALSHVYKMISEKFNCYTNPIWIRKPDLTTITAFKDDIRACSVFPNPFYNTIQILLKQSMDSDIQFRLYNALGCTVASGQLSAETKGSTQCIKTEDLPSGYYLLNLSVDKQHYFFRLLKAGDEYR